MILQDFLLCGLISIGDEDTRLMWLDASATALAKEFKKHKRKLINGILVALDEDLPEGEPVFDEVETIVLTHWKAMRGKYPDRPRNILRAVILAALDKLRDDPVTSSIIWLIGGSYLPHARIGKERAIVEALFKSLGDIAEKEATNLWTIERNAVEIELPAWTAKLEPPKGHRISEDWLRERLAAATGAGGEQDGYPKNNHQMSNGYGAMNYTAWAGHFSAHAAKAIVESVGTKINSKDVVSSFEQLDGMLTEYGKALLGAVKESVQRSKDAQAAQDRRSSLLWWRQTLYSPTARRGYRGLTSGALAALTALDLHKEMPSYAPQSVEYLLREVVRAVATNDVKIDGEKLLSEMKVADASLNLTKQLGAQSAENSGRVCLLTFSRNVLSGNENLQDLVSKLGIASTLQLPLEEWSVWLFRDLQANRLASGK